MSNCLVKPAEKGLLQGLDSDWQLCPVGSCRCIHRSPVMVLGRNWMTGWPICCCCDLTLLGLSQSMSKCLGTSLIRTVVKNFMDSVTSTAGGITNTTAWFKDHLLISKERLQKQNKGLTDQATVINTVEHLHASQEGKKKKRTLVQCTHAHTQIFSNTPV